MTKEEALQIVTHIGDCYRFKKKGGGEPFNFYVSEITNNGLWQEGADLELEFLPFDEIESVEAY